MSKNFLPYYLICFVLLTVMGLSYGQSPQRAYMESEIQVREVDKENWAKTIEGIDYAEEAKKKVEDYDEDFSDSPSASSGSTPRSYPSGGGSSAFWAGFFKVLFIILIATAIALLVVHFMGAGTFTSPTNRRFAKSDTRITIDNVEEHIYESDLDRFIRESVEKKNYTLAIRLYYLAIIKELSLNKTIRWKKDKTNRDYLREMRKTGLFQAFREATGIFERIWYGKSEFNESDYLAVKPKFDALVKAAQNNQLSIESEA